MISVVNKETWNGGNERGCWISRPKRFDETILLTIHDVQEIVESKREFNNLIS